MLQKRLYNRIIKLKDGQGKWKNEPTIIVELLTQRSSSMFNSNGCVGMESYLEVVSPLMIDLMNEDIVKVTYKEVRNVMFGLGALKASRLTIMVSLGLFPKEL